jgi:hypothetical protein
VAALASSDLDNSFEFESMSLAVGAVDEMASYDWFFLGDDLHLRKSFNPVNLDIAIL